MKTSEAVNDIAQSLFKLQQDIAENPLVADARNPQFDKHRYAKLESVCTYVAHMGAQHGLAFLQELVGTETQVGVVTRIQHIGGQWIEMGPYYVPLTPRKAGAAPDPQAAGSAATYARRYSLLAAIGTAADEDDDGHAVSTAANAAPQRTAEASDVVRRVTQQLAMTDVRVEAAPQARRKTGVMVGKKDARVDIADLSPKDLSYWHNKASTPGAEQYEESRLKQLAAIDAEIDYRRANGKL